jgi:uncharacterized membrane protein
LVGLYLLFREANRAPLPPARNYIGWILIGGGAFNFVEGLIDHEILGLHHVRETANWLSWDIGFLVLGGLLLVGIGWLLRHEPRRINPAQGLSAA